MPSFVALLLALDAGTARGQSALDGFDPNVNDTVTVVAVQPDGKTLLGGSFTSIGGVTRNHIARLNADGTLDPAFNPNANGFVNAIAVQSDGKILVGGSFAGANSIGGAARNFIARLDGETGSADSWNPSADNEIYSIAVQADGKVLVGGTFSNIGSQIRGAMARLDGSSGLADSFNPSANGNVLSIVVQSDGKILAGGLFSGIGGQSRHFIGRLDASTGAADSFDPAPNGSVRSIALQADGKIVVGGQFSGANSIGDATRNYIARLDPATGLSDSFNPGANSLIFSLVVQPDGKILAGGYFNGANSIGGATRNYIARLDPITGLADSFDPNAGNIVQSIAIQQDGKIFAGGNFTSFAPNGGPVVSRNHIARLEADGRVDQTLDLDLIGNLVAAIAVQPDGKTIIGGDFTQVLGVTRNNIARLNTDGTLDSAFNPNANGFVLSIVVQADSRILVGGTFNGANSIGGATRNRIARLNADGATDSFNPNANSTVYSIAMQGDGKILVGGNFNGNISSPTIGGQPRDHIARLDPVTGLADGFDPGPNGTVNSLAVQVDNFILVGGAFAPDPNFGGNSIGSQPRKYIARLDPITGAAGDGNLFNQFAPNASAIVDALLVQPAGGILVAGAFTNISHTPRQFMARLDSSGTADPFFDPSASAIVNSMAVQFDGKILAGGEFGGGGNSIGGQPRNYIARLGATSGAADSLDPNANGFVRSITVQGDGKILVGGNFSLIGGQTRNRFARLKNDIAALQNLAVTPDTITWTHGESFLNLSNSTTEIRGGASPQFTRVTFESSTNNLNYSLLGNGSVAGSDWTLAGLNLPIGQSIYIRARGYYRSGYQNNSESISESVRNAFLAALPPPPPRLNIQRSGVTNVVLSWPTNFTGFTLEANTNLNTSLWSVASPSPTVSGTNNVVTNDISGFARFYRLRK